MPKQPGDYELRYYFRQTRSILAAQPIKVDVRVIAATNLDLDKAVRDEKLRPDLYYRLSVFPIWVPPIRERREDIPLLVRHFVRKYSTKLGRPIDSVSETAMTSLLSYTWPGNVRELENVIERAVILSQGPVLELRDCFRRPENGGGAPGLQTLDDVQREHISKVLKFAGGVVSGAKGAASILGIKATTLESRMKKLGVQRPRSQPSPNLPQHDQRGSPTDRRPRF